MSEGPNGMRHILLPVVALLSSGFPALAADAKDALQRSNVCREFHETALGAWQRVFTSVLGKKGSLGPGRRGMPPRFYLYAGRIAFHRRDYALARSRLMQAQALAEDAGEKGAAREALLWRVGAELGLRRPDSLPRLQKTAMETRNPAELFLLAYLLDRLGVEMEGERKELYARADKLAETGPVSPDAARHRAWLALRLERRTTYCLKTLSDPLGRACPLSASAGPSAHPTAKGSDQSPRATVHLFDVARLHELSLAYARLAFERAAEMEEDKIRAALRLGLYREASRLAHLGAARPSADQPYHRLQAQTWLLLAQAAGEGMGRKGALDRFHAAILSPEFEKENGTIHYALLQRLAEVLIATGRREKALEVAGQAVASLERHYKTGLTDDKLPNYYEQSRPVYATLAHTQMLNGKLAESLRTYEPVLPKSDEAWSKILVGDPLFAVRYGRLLLESGDPATARKRVFEPLSAETPARYPLVVHVLAALSAGEKLALWRNN